MKTRFEFTPVAAKVFKEMYDAGEFADIIAGLDIETDATKLPPKNLPVLKLEQLEERLVPELTIDLDYSLDTSGFFDTPENRKAIQDAADDPKKQVFDEDDDPC